MNQCYFKRVTLAISALVVSAASPTTVQAETRREQCYGIVKAGKNDCAAADATHSCATYAKRHGNGQDWIALPEGICDRIIGASLTPTEAEGTYATAPKNQKN